MKYMSSTIQPVFAVRRQKPPLIENSLSLPWFCQSNILRKTVAENCYKEHWKRSQETWILVPAGLQTYSTTPPSLGLDFLTGTMIELDQVRGFSNKGPMNRLQCQSVNILEPQQFATQVHMCTSVQKVQSFSQLFTGSQDLQKVKNQQITIKGPFCLNILIAKKVDLNFMNLQQAKSPKQDTKSC